LNLLAVGRLVHQKDYQVLVAAMRQVADADPTIRCRIAGEGPERPMIEAAVNRHGLEDHVELLGTRTDVDQLLADADIFVSSSASEGLPVSVLEAMATGLPVICTDVGDVRVAVPDAAGIVVAPGAPGQLAEAVLAMADDRDRRIRCGDVGRRHVQDHHDPGRWAEKLAGIYREMIGCDVGNVASPT